MTYSSGPQPFWHQGLVSWKTIFPWMEGLGRRDRKWSSGSNVSEASLAGPLITSCCVAWFVKGHGPVPVHGLGVGDPWRTGTSESLGRNSRQLDPQRAQSSSAL